jgi:phytoene synthase
MVNAGVTSAATAERALALGYAPAAKREGLAALFALDATLGQVVRGTREPLVGQMRLTWWRDALTALDERPPPAQPVLVAIATQVQPHGVNGATLATMTQGWEQLFAEPLDADAMAAHARERGGVLFAAAERLLGGHRPDVAVVGEGWALADLGAGLRDPAAADMARDLAGKRLDGAARGRWPRALRPLGALALLARDDLAGGTAGSPRRISRVLAHRLTGL